MGAQVVSFLNWSRPAAPPPAVDWSQQELAEFYRVESALIRAGLRIETDRGLSDEGDPWFVFLRAEDGEVVVHFARVDGEYLIAGPAYEQVARGYDFNMLVRAMIARHPLVEPQRRDGKVLLHPAAILVAIVGTAFFKTGDAKAMENDDRSGSAARKAPAAASRSAPPAQAEAKADPSYHAQVDANQALTILAGAMFAMEPRWDDHRQAAAAQALNFGSEAARQAADVDFWTTGELRFDGLRAEATRPVALAEAPAVLALAAVLDAVAQPRAVQAPAEAAMMDSGVTHPALSENAGLGEPPAAYLDLQLRPGPLPRVEAVQILREAMVGGGLEKIALVSVDKIPEAIAHIIADGASLNGASVTAGIVEAAPTITPDAAPPAWTPAESDAPVVDGDTTTTAPTVEAAQPAPQAPQAPPPPVPQAPPLDAYKLLVQKVINYFVDHTADVQVLTSGLEVVLYDGRIEYAAHEIAWVDSVTFHFDDGSSISLVGEHSTLYHELA